MTTSTTGEYYYPTAQSTCVSRVSGPNGSVNQHHYWQILDRRSEKIYTDSYTSNGYIRIRRFTIFYCVYCTTERLVDDPAVS